MNKDLSKSGFIFQLIDEFEIFNRAGGITPWTDEAFNLFCNKYRSSAEIRDAALLNYLKNTPNLFRCHLPDSKWSYDVVSEVIWYYDEIIMNDPILAMMDLEFDVELKKSYIREHLRYLIESRECLDRGYLLFKSKTSLIVDKTNFDKEITNLLEVPEVINAFEAISVIGGKPSPINDDERDNLTQLQIYYQGFWHEIRKMSMYIPPHVFDEGKVQGGIYYDFVNPLSRLTREDLISYNKIDLLDGLKTEYSKDISTVLEALAGSPQLNAPTLFFRDADAIAARNYISKSSKKLMVDKSVYNCALPYLGGIPPSRLFDLRNSIPLEFEQFRAFLFELVTSVMKSTDDPAEQQFKINRGIGDAIREIEVEMKSANRKWNFQGNVAPIILMTGSLGLFKTGVDYSTLFSFLMSSGGLLARGSASVDFKNSKNDISLNPAYFLWKAQE